MKVSPLSLSMLSTHKRMSSISGTFNFHKGLNKFRCIVVKQNMFQTVNEGKTHSIELLCLMAITDMLLVVQKTEVYNHRAMQVFIPEKKSRPDPFIIWYMNKSKLRYFLNSVLRLHTQELCSTIRHFRVHLLSTMLHLWWIFKQSQNAVNFTFILQMRF